jgi:hypothetical protein
MMDPIGIGIEVEVPFADSEKKIVSATTAQKPTGYYSYWPVVFLVVIELPFLVLGIWCIWLI